MTSTTRNNSNSTFPKDWNVVFVINDNGMYPKYWKGDSAGHARAGRIGGLKQSHKTNPYNFKNNPKRAAEMGKKKKRHSGEKNEPLPPNGFKQK